MGIEVDLLENYPKTKRDVKGRGAEKTEEHRAIARKFESGHRIIEIFGILFQHSLENFTACLGVHGLNCRKQGQG